MVVSGVALMAGALASSGAQAQCSGNGIQENFPFGAGGSVNALTSVISTANTAFMNNGSPFVSAPAAVPDQQGGGIWIRTIGGTVETQANSNFSGSFSLTQNGWFGPTTTTSAAQGSCHTKVAQDYAGFQAGHDIALLNPDNSGMNWHFGAMAGVIGAGARDLSPGGTLSSDFQVPFAGLYTAFSKGNFFADAQARFDYFQSELNDPNANGIFNQRLDARGYSITGNAGYRFDLGGNWSLEPSVGGVYSSTSVDPFTVGGTYASSQGTSMPGTVQINRVESELGRASIKVGTAVASDDGRIVAYPFATASVFHEFAGSVNASVTSSGTGIDSFGNPMPWTATGGLTTSRIGTYAQFGLGSAFQLANTGWLSYARVDYRTGDYIQGISVNAGLRYQLNPETASLKEGGSLKDGPAQGYDWTGPYVGASAGGTSGRTRLATNADSVTPDFAGYLVGGEAGYNYQVGFFVWGVEGDLGRSGARGASPCTNNPILYSCEDGIGALGSVTGRIGYSWGRALFYAKGGWAIGEVTADTHLNTLAANGLVPNVMSATHWENGWTAGGGMEFALNDKWSAKAEYMHYELQSASFTVQEGVTPTGTTIGDAVRVGANYHLGRTSQEDGPGGVSAGGGGLKDGTVYAPNVWTGFYVGIHTGAARSTTKISDPYPAFVQNFNDNTLCGLYGACGLFPDNFSPSHGDQVDASGPFAGGQIGLNYQVGRIVAGLEADASFAQIDGTNTCFAVSYYFLSSNCQMRVDAMGTFTGRLGTTFGANDRTLIYAKGGAAWEELTASSTWSSGQNGSDLDFTSKAGFHGIRLGWTVGAGIEHALTPNWSVKAEYDYLNFGSFAMTTPGGSLAYMPTYLAGPAPNANITQDLHQVKLGVNYRLGDPGQWGDADSLKDGPVTLAPAWQVQLGTRYAGSWGRFQKDLGTNGPNASNLQSRLTYNNMTTNGGELFARIDTPDNFVLKGFAGLGQGNTGQMNDEDWALLGMFSDPYYSNTVSKTSEDIKYGTIDAGYNVFNEAGYKVTPFAGYTVLSQYMKANGCQPNAGNDVVCWNGDTNAPGLPTSQLVATQTNTWQALRVGAAADFVIMPGLKLSVDAAYLPYVTYKGTDNHLAR